jgi:hypothetical protein
MPRQPLNNRDLLRSAIDAPSEQDWRLAHNSHWHTAYTRNLLPTLRDLLDWPTPARSPQGQPFTLLDALKAINKAQYRDWPELERYNPTLAKKIRHNGWVTRVKEALRTRVF